jgi:transcriptional regulator with XRE-family HTH domain
LANFGQRLKLLRNERNISLDILAEKLQTTKATLSRYENSKRIPNIEFAKKVSEFFGVTTDFMYGLTDDKNSNTETNSSDILSETDKKYNFVIEKAKNAKISAEKLDKLIDALLDDK